MTSRSENPLRPPGFPFSEQELQDFRRIRMRGVIQGKYLSLYDEWALRGVPKEEFHPKVALAIFPVPALTSLGYELEPEMLELDQDHRPLLDYWRDTVTLPYPSRIRSYEETYFRSLIGEGDQLQVAYTGYLNRMILPTVLVLFSKGSDPRLESAYMFSPSAIPPSATYRHMIEQAKRHVSFS